MPTPSVRNKLKRETMVENLGYRNLAVPYFSQWSDPVYARKIVQERLDPCADPSWHASGFASEEDYRFWSDRLCGLACLRSILGYWGIPAPPVNELLDQAIKFGAYVRHPDGRMDGLIYAPFMKWLQAEFQLHGSLFPQTSMRAISREISTNCLAIASVSKEIRYPDRPNVRRGGHLVLVHGWDDTDIWFHNPSGVERSQSDVMLSYEIFNRFYAERGMLIFRD